MDLAAVILAGGRGTRLQTVVSDRPKPLAPVAGRPFLAYLLDQVVDAGVGHIVLSTGYLAEQFAVVIGSTYRGIEIDYAQEDRPLGTGGAIRFAGQWANADHLLVMNGDSYCDADLRVYFAWHRAGGQDASLMLVKVDDASRYGTVEISADGHIQAFLEKRSEPAPGYINAGVYLLRKQMLEQLPEGSSSIERDAFPAWINQYAVKGWVPDGAFIDIGIPSDYQRSHEFMTRVRRTDQLKPTVFVDRDGTINREVHHLSSPDQLELLPGAADGLRALCTAGHPLVVVSNQSPIGRGMFTEARLGEIHARLTEMLAAEGVRISGWYWCPHAPWEGCACRKPAPGMLFKARDEMGVILETSWVVGDRLSDLRAGRQVGARTILVATGYGQEEYALPERPESADFFVPTLREAAEVILSN
jgi:histidinol-phosphate phosphatase family protein